MMDFFFCMKKLQKSQKLRKMMTKIEKLGNLLFRDFCNIFISKKIHHPKIQFFFSIQNHLKIVFKWFWGKFSFFFYQIFFIFFRVRFLNVSDSLNRHRWRLREYIFPPNSWKSSTPKIPKSSFEKKNWLFLWSMILIYNGFQ